MNKIATCLWFDNQAEEAANFYTNVFETSRILGVSRYGKAGAKMSGQKEGSVMVVDFEIENQSIQALNGGPIFKFTPALSYVISCKTEDELNKKWKKLSDGGTVRMELDKYPWAEKYGWTADRYGVDWQLTLNPSPAKITPSFLFVNNMVGKGDDALKFYTSIFPNSKINMMAREDKSGRILYSEFSLEGQTFSLMEGDGKHDYTFTHATSIVVHCDTQKEIDFYWDKLSEGGSIEECGWLQDKFGVSWQIVPSQMYAIMPDPVKSDLVMAAMTGMKKLDMGKLMAAAK
jgi:predicted 3-demethylubiquinone-9 3-methyltransferase (glyoxalase superfamily)